MVQTAASSTGPTYTITIHQSQEIGGPTPLTLDSEWLLTNGLGGFAMGSVCGCNTRRYHSLLTTAARPPVQRFNLLAAMSDSVLIDGQWFDLSCQEFQATQGSGTLFHPHGYTHLRRFEKEADCVRWHYQIGPVTLVKELRLLWEKPAAVLAYTLEKTGSRRGADQGLPPRIHLRPLLAMRDFHAHRYAQEPMPFKVAVEQTSAGPGLRVDTHEGPPFFLTADRGTFHEKWEWWFGFHHRREAERGQDDREDLFVPGFLDCDFGSDQGPLWKLSLTIGGEPIHPVDLPPSDARQIRIGRSIGHFKERLKSTGDVHWRLIEGLVAAADDFVVCRAVNEQTSLTIVAGYPWFADWGRDAMISLPGLLLCTGRFEEARQVLLTFSQHLDKGLIPNCFDDYTARPQYNTADASLWFIHAALEYLRITHDRQTWEGSLRPACMQIVEAYRRGTAGPISMDSDGLILSGNADTQLTWMDAKRDGVVFTPRYGKAVEINAMWHRALAGLDEKALAAQVAESFNRTFWSDDLGCLYDHVNDKGADRTLRPNQVLAVSLPDSPLPPDRQRSVMRIVREKLLTPMGLRTLPRDDPNYHGRFEGGMFQRDRAYHQGTVWPWLIGPFVEGWLRAHGFSDPARQEAREALAPLLKELARHSIGQLHEVYDGDEPHRPGGCIAQAWSIAEVLRAMILIEG